MIYYSFDSSFFLTTKCNIIYIYLTVSVVMENCGEVN